MWWHKERCECCPWDLAEFCVFKALLLAGSQPRNLGTVSYLLSSRKGLARGCGPLEAVGACLPSGLREDNVRSFLEPVLESDSVWGEARITRSNSGGKNKTVEQQGRKMPRGKEVLC